MVQYCVDKEAWAKKGEYELTKLNFIEADEIKFDVDFVNIDRGIPDFSFFMVCDFSRLEENLTRLQQLYEECNKVWGVKETIHTEHYIGPLRAFEVYQFSPI